MKKITEQEGYGIRRADLYDKKVWGQHWPEIDLAFVVKDFHPLGKKINPEFIEAQIVHELFHASAPGSMGLLGTLIEEGMAEMLAAEYIEENINSEEMAANLVSRGFQVEKTDGKNWIKYKFYLTNGNFIEAHIPPSYFYLGDKNDLPLYALFSCILQQVFRIAPQARDILIKGRRLPDGGLAEFKKVLDQINPKLYPLLIDAENIIQFTLPDPTNTNAKHPRLKSVLDQINPKLYPLLFDSKNTITPDISHAVELVFDILVILQQTRGDEIPK